MNGRADRFVWLRAAAAALLLATVPCGASVEPAHTQAAAILARQFASSDLSYLLLDVRTGMFVAERWAGSNAPIPMGSLVKPFAALAYAEGHGFRFPEHTCTGVCWYPKGHGTLGISRALALSCNSYFAALGAEVSARQATYVARRFGLRGPGADASSEALAGMHGVWRESPKAIALAYAELLAERAQPGIREVVGGMAGAARYGTASGVSRSVLHVPALAKTGTAPCTHRHRAPGDGFAVIAWPADSPRYILLVREHGRPGAEAASLAGRMFRALETQ